MGRENCVVLALVYVYLELGALVSGAMIYPSVQWSFQNPRFKEGTFRLNVLPLSKINIICPHMATSLLTTDDSNSNSYYENFWIVDYSSYHSCNVNTSITDNKILFKCDKPLQLNFEQLVFQSVGMDNSAVFKKGKTYYFISTSTGSQGSLDNTKNGHCLTENMKMQIYICNGTQDVYCSDVKTTTLPTMVDVNVMRLKMTAKPSTARTETTQLTSSQQPSPTELNSTQTPKEPEVDYLEKRKEAAVMSVTVWIVIVVMLGTILVVSVGINFHFWRKQKQFGSKKPPYDRGNSLSPPLVDHL